MQGFVGHIVWNGHGSVSFWLNDAKGRYVGCFEVKRSDSTSKVCLGDSITVNPGGIEHKRQDGTPSYLQLEFA